MADWIYVDNSNLFIEGMRVSAVFRGLATDIHEALKYNITDNRYRVDLGKLYQFVAGSNIENTARAMLFGSRPPPNDAIWALASKAGFEVVVYNRNAGNREKKIDTSMVVAIMDDANIGAKEGDTFTIVSGDNDFVPLVENLRRKGFQVDVVFWDHAGRELRNAATNFVSLDQHLDTLRF